MVIDIVGEDHVTREIITRLISDYRADLTIGTSHPVRGHQIKSAAPKYNVLGTPIFLLADEDDAGCPPALLRDWLDNKEVSHNMLFRVARTEAEVWLMADRIGIAKWLKIDRQLIPTPVSIGKNPEDLELPFPYKPSLYLMKDLASQSADVELRLALTPRDLAKKGPGYNTAIIPFIRNSWEPERARKASTSLDRAIIRLQQFNP